MRDRRLAPYRYLNAILRTQAPEWPRAAREGITENAVFDVAHPVNRLEGVEAILEGFYRPLRRAFAGLRRRDEMFFGGRNRRSQGGYWVASVTHYVGNFREPFLGVAPSGRLVFLRSGEFYQIEQDGRISAANLLLDLLDLLRQSGRFPLPRELGTEMLFPSPATHDGVLPANRAKGEASLDIVERMLASLHDFDPDSFESSGQIGSDGTWHDDMLWYGPGGIGASYRWEGFQKDHRIPFLRAFPDRKGGNHLCRIGDGNYAAVCGWPSMTLTHRAPYLGIPPTNVPSTLRVMDFYRCRNDRIVENWVLLDYVQLLHQWGIDILARAAETG